MFDATSAAPCPMPRFVCVPCGVVVYGQLAMVVPCGRCGNALLRLEETCLVTNFTASHGPSLLQCP